MFIDMSDYLSYMYAVQLASGDISKRSTSLLVELSKILKENTLIPENDVFISRKELRELINKLDSEIVERELIGTK